MQIIDWCIDPHGGPQEYFDYVNIHISVESKRGWLEFPTCTSIGFGVEPIFDPFGTNSHHGVHGYFSWGIFKPHAERKFLQSPNLLFDKSVIFDPPQFLNWKDVFIQCPKEWERNAYRIWLRPGVSALIDWQAKFSLSSLGEVVKLAL